MKKLKGCARNWAGTFPVLSPVFFLLCFFFFFGGPRSNGFFCKAVPSVFFFVFFFPINCQKAPPTKRWGQRPRFSARPFWANPSPSMKPVSPSHPSAESRKRKVHLRDAGRRAPPHPFSTCGWGFPPPRIFFEAPSPPGPCSFFLRPLWGLARPHPAFGFPDLNFGPAYR